MSLGSHTPNETTTTLHGLARTRRFSEPQWSALRSTGAERPHEASESFRSISYH